MKGLLALVVCLKAEAEPAVFVFWDQNPLGKRSRTKIGISGRHIRKAYQSWTSTTSSHVAQVTGPLGLHNQHAAIRVCANPEIDVEFFCWLHRIASMLFEARLWTWVRIWCRGLTTSAARMRTWQNLWWNTSCTIFLFFALSVFVQDMLLSGRISALPHLMVMVRLTGGMRTGDSVRRSKPRTFQSFSHRRSVDLCMPDFYQMLVCGYDMCFDAWLFFAVRAFIQEPSIFRTAKVSETSFCWRRVPMLRTFYQRPRPGL